MQEHEWNGWCSVKYGDNDSGESGESHERGHHGHPYGNDALYVSLKTRNFCSINVNFRFFPLCKFDIFFSFSTFPQNRKP